MQNKLRFLFRLLLLISAIGIYSAFAGIQTELIPELPTAFHVEAQKDTVPVKYPVAKTTVESYKDLKDQKPVDLKTPSNIKTQIDYDPTLNAYLIRTKVGDMEINTPFMMTSDEYQNYRLQQSMQNYFKEKNSEIFKNGTSEFNFMDMNFSLGPAEKLFGPGGVQIKTQGSAEINFALKSNNTDNPTLPLRSRSKTYFDFEQNLQLNVNAKVGDKLNFGMNYNTDATFDFDSKQLKLAYEGKEDEIIKVLEAGNVSMTTGSSLIRGGQSLFGVKAGMQFGKLKLTTVISQQESESKQVNMKGGAQTTPFEIAIDQYDENRHFFLGHFFRDNYDRFVSKLPYVSSGINVSRIEVWVTNRRGNYDQARNIVAFMDLAEPDRLANKYWQKTTTLDNPFNQANNLLETIIRDYPDARNIDKVTQALQPLAQYNILGGTDYEKLESARKLEPSEYTLNTKLGYISLRSMLQPDEVLAVAYEYTKNGKPYQVGEFSSDLTETKHSLYLKMLKGTGSNPLLPMWKLMMKNIYSLNSYNVQKDKFRLDIMYLSDTTGLYLNYLPAGRIKNEILLRVMNLDRLNSQLQPYPDGFFDFVEGYTVVAQTGRLIFPVIEPFGSHLKDKIGDDDIAKKYVYQELYDSTLTVARQIADKNKFKLKGEFKSSSGAEISLNAMNVPRGSVHVTAGGQTLTENVDYSVDYGMGVVTILNQSYIDSGTPISVQLENQSAFSMQRKTLLGFDMSYAFTPNFSIGATLMHLSEKPMTNKINIGDEPLKNTIYGFNTSYKTQSQWLTNMVDKLPFVQATFPSTLALTAEFAQILPGHPSELKQKGESYIDDFESSQLGIDLRNPYAWQLCSTPFDPSPTGLFPEAGLMNDVRYGYNRALLSWYYIDRIFTQKGSSLTPTHIKNDLDQLSDHNVREIYARELFPNKDFGYGESSVMQVLNLSYYPLQRGPYNLDATNIDDQGRLLFPQKRWGGMMRKMDVVDFEASNIEYLQFWMMDPFMKDEDSKATGGDLYFNLGEISEDILKDGLKSFESGLPVNGDMSQVIETVWGRVPRRQFDVYAFDNSPGAREKQDVGLDGLSTEDEFKYPAYAEYVKAYDAKLTPDARERLRQDPFSPLNDPAGDNFHHFRGADYDNQELDIISRYRYYNNTEGNSTPSSDGGFDNTAKSVPDVEDINQDNTMNEYERYFQYKISIRKKDLQVGDNFITDKRTTTVKLRNGKEEEVSWYQFKIPLKEYEKRVGAIRDFKTIRFMRLFMTQFETPITLRFGILELVRGDWRTYTQALTNASAPATDDGMLNVSVVNIEENAGREPVNYVLPPGVSRVIDPGQTQITQLNEQSMSLEVLDLAPLQSKAVYKNTSYDMRQFRRLQMFGHAEAIIDDKTNLQNGELTVFLRLGSDFKDNYYEYEIPMSLTPPGKYNTYSLNDQLAVWPKENMFDFPLSLFTNLKMKRNLEKRKEHSDVTFYTPYSTYDPDKLKNKITIKGNPSLSDVRTIMIGIRNNASASKSGIVWVDELRMADFDEKGGWAARANINLGISDIATLNVGGHVETIGFGGIDQGLLERRMDDYYLYNVATTVELGRFFPESFNVKAPLFYSYSNQTLKPKYNPIDQDILFKDALDIASTTHERDSLTELAVDRVTVESFSLSGVKVDIHSNTPMPYDPANFSFSYAHNKQYKKNPSTIYENNYDYRGNLTYSYTPLLKPFMPLGWINSKSPYLRMFKELGLNYAPNNVTFSTNMNRYYFEQQLRDLNNPNAINSIPLSYRKNFIWDRQFGVQWDITKQLRFNLNVITNATIEEPNVPVNKRLFPDEYQQWKDTVMKSIKSLGTPLNYNQLFNLSYDVPLNKIPILDWTTVKANYYATYSWDRGVLIDPTINVGNVVNNRSEFKIDFNHNMENLYNKWSFLKEINRKFASSKRESKSDITKEKRKFVEQIQLREDTTILLHHNLNNKKLIVKAEKTNGTRFPIKYKVVDPNTIEIQNRDSISLKLTVIQNKDTDETLWYQTIQYTMRTAMLLRKFSISYRNTNTTMLPSFNTMIGDFIGQAGGGGSMSPGLGFAFGLEGGEDYIRKAKDKGWLIVNDILVTPAIFTHSENLRVMASLEPIRGLKIELNLDREVNQNNTMSFMFDGMPNLRGGNFTITTIALKTALSSTNQDNAYQSTAFENFIKYRETIATRIQQRYIGQRYPSEGFIEGTPFAGTEFNPALSNVNLNSSDVMIPAFLAAYTGGDPNKIGLTPFPSLKSLLPNWRMSFEGLMQIPFFKKNFRSFTLSHAYRCSYSVGAYNSYLNWVDATGGLGYVKDVLSGSPIPSTPYDISSVSLQESFMPLIGVDMSFKNNMTARAEYKDSRMLSLNMPAVQIIEAISREFTIGSGYKIANFNTVLKIKDRETGVNNDLNLRVDLSYRKNHSLLRRVDEHFTQATSGTQSLSIKFGADYTMSKLITLRGFYDYQFNTPLVSSTSYPMSNSSYGISLRLSLTR